MVPGHSAHRQAPNTNSRKSSSRSWQRVREEPEGERGGSFLIDTDEDKPHIHRYDWARHTALWSHDDHSLFFLDCMQFIARSTRTTSSFQDWLFKRPGWLQIFGIHFRRFLNRVLSRKTLIYTRGAHTGLLFFFVGGSRHGTHFVVIFLKTEHLVVGGSSWRIR